MFGMFGFVVIYAVLVIGTLVWALGPEKTPAPPEHQDKGGMTDQGVPYVPGPPRS